MSSSSFEENVALFAPFITPSGMFTSKVDQGSTYGEAIQSENHPVIFYNPMPPAVQQTIVDSVPVECINDLPSKFKKLSCFAKSDFDSYAYMLIERLAWDLLRNNHDALLFPLRGCRYPGILIKVIAGVLKTKMVIFNYTYATQKCQRGFIESQLIEQLRERLTPDQRVINVGVVDTAIGGYGSKNLAEMLSLIHGRYFANQHWLVQLHLLHENKSPPRLSFEIPKFDNNKLKFVLNFYGVESLLVEDWPEGIGLAVNKTKEYFALERHIEPGRILYRNAQDIHLMESESLCDTMTSLAVDAINRVMLNSPQIEYIRDI